jgi:hypothetical protein
MDKNRRSKMKQAEGSRDAALDNERMSSSSESGERMRNRDSSEDLGSSSDRAMMTGRSGEARPSPRDGGSSSSSGVSAERGSGSSDERNSGSSDAPSSRSGSGGISNRDLDREQCEQDRVPERGRSQSER